VGQSGEKLAVATAFSVTRRPVAAPLSGDIESVVVCTGKRGMINNDITDVVIAHSLFI